MLRAKAFDDLFGSVDGSYGKRMHMMNVHDDVRDIIKCNYWFEWKALMIFMYRFSICLEEKDISNVGVESNTKL